MKRFLMILICLGSLLGMTACKPPIVETQVPVSQPAVPITEAAPNSQAPHAEDAFTADLVFSYSGADPSALALETDATVTLNGYLNQEGGDYRGEFCVIRSIPGEDVLLQYRYDSLDFSGTVGAQREKIRFQSYYCSKGTDKSFCFDLSYPVVVRRGGLDEMSYTLSEQGDTVSLTLWLNDTEKITVDASKGKLTLPIAPSMEQTLRLIISDSFFTTSYLEDRDLFRVLCTAEKTQGGYEGILRLSRTGEIFHGSSYTATGAGEQWEEPVSIASVPFNQSEYRAAGGRMGAFLTAPLSAMSITKAGEHTAIFTASGSQVFLELPDLAKEGYFLGRTDPRSDGGQIAAEEEILFRQDYLFRTTPQDDVSDMDEAIADMQEAAADMGDALSQEELEVFAQMYENNYNELTGQSLWLPPDFIPMPDAIDMDEAPPSGDLPASFSYTTEGHVLDEIIPMMQQHFSDMRNYRFQEGEYIYGHYGATIQFDYGEGHVDLSLTPNPIVGTDVTLYVTRNN